VSPVAGLLLLLRLTRRAALLFQSNASSGKRTGSRAAAVDKWTVIFVAYVIMKTNVVNSVIDWYIYRYSFIKQMTYASETCIELKRIFSFGIITVMCVWNCIVYV